MPDLRLLLPGVLELVVVEVTVRDGAAHHDPVVARQTREDEVGRQVLEVGRREDVGRPPAVAEGALDGGALLRVHRGGSPRCDAHVEGKQAERRRAVFADHRRGGTLRVQGTAAVGRFGRPFGEPVSSAPSRTASGPSSRRRSRWVTS